LNKVVSQLVAKIGSIKGQRAEVADPTTILFSFPYSLELFIIT